VSLLTAQDFPRWTRSMLGLEPTANLAAEIERHILTADDHLRYLIGDDKYEELASTSTSNAERRRRFVNAAHHLTESRLYGVQAETLGMRAGSSTQGARSKTITAEATRGARAAAGRSYGDFVRAMFQLGIVTREQTLNEFFTLVSR
jgi:hypothetical protein